MRYSVRLRRCASGSWPTCGRAAAARSSAVSRNVTTAACVGSSGRGMLTGGIDLPRSFVTTFSHWSAAAPTSASPAGSMTNPAVFTRSLWQVTQYRSRTAAGWTAVGTAGSTTARDRGGPAVCVRTLTLADQKKTTARATRTGRTAV